MKRAILNLSISLCTVSILFASDTSQDQDFQSLLDNASDIATKKAINTNYMPAVVTVINAQTFLDAGIQNVAEALDMLPGMQEQVSPMGYTINTVRGLKTPNSYYADQVKILVDGVAINNDVTGTGSFYLDFPMQLVEKIEVLRGPASTMYGGGAYYGAINIITRLGSSKKQNQIYAGGGSYGTITAGTDLFTTQNGWDIYTDGYATSNDKALPFTPNGGTPRYTDEAKRDYSVGFKAKKDGWEFLTRLKHETSGNFYSFEGGLNPIPDRPENHSNIYFLSQLKYTTNIDDYKLETKLNYSHRNESVNANINNIATVDGYPIDGFYAIENLQEENFGVESTLTIPTIDSNDILIGVGATYDKVTQDNYFSSLENTIVENGISGDASFRYNANNEPAYWLDPTSTTVVPNNISRTNIYTYAQDLISINDKTDLILGLRLDNYSDFGSELSKRTGIVYRASDEITLKLLYGSAYRLPTFTEAYALGHINLRMGDPTMKPEEANTYETAIVYTPNFYNKFSLNFYYTKLHNVIDIEELDGTPIGYQNQRDRETKGVEFEYFYKTGVKHNFYFNASYINADYTSSKDGSTQATADPAINMSMPDISPIMFKALYIYKPTSKLSFGTAWKYFSATTATKILWVVDEVNSGQIQSSVPAVHIFDETATYHFTSSNEIRFSVKNLFNAVVLQPAYYYDSAKDGIQREGRNYMITYVQRF